MKTFVVAVYDRKTKQYGALMNPRNIDRVQDEFDDVCAKPDQIYNKYPGDFEVHLLGEFNDSPEHDPHLVNSWLAAPRVIALGRAREVNHANP